MEITQLFHAHGFLQLPSGLAGLALLPPFRHAEVAAVAEPQVSDREAELGRQMEAPGTWHEKPTPGSSRESPLRNRTNGT